MFRAFCRALHLTPEALHFKAPGIHDAKTCSVRAQTCSLCAHCLDSCHSPLRSTPHTSAPYSMPGRLTSRMRPLASRWVWLMRGTGRGWRMGQCELPPHPAALWWFLSSSPSLQPSVQSHGHSSCEFSEWFPPYLFRPVSPMANPSVFHPSPLSTPLEMALF